MPYLCLTSSSQKREGTHTQSLIPVSWCLSSTGHSIHTRLERKRDTRRRSYHGVENDEHDSQECQGLKPIQVFVSQDPVVLTGDQANLVNHQLFWGQGQEAEISDEGCKKERSFFLSPCLINTPERRGPQNQSSPPLSSLSSFTHPGGPHTKGSGTSRHSVMTKREIKPSVSAGTAGQIADLTWA